MVSFLVLTIWQALQKSSKEQRYNTIITRFEEHALKLKTSNLKMYQNSWTVPYFARTSKEDWYKNEIK